jgi:cbb3-type cytochrome oxidase subunit 1
VSRLLPLFEWCDNTPVSVAIRDSRVLFPAIETVHLFALTVLLGTTIVVSLRLMGVTLRREPLAELAAELAPWIDGSIVVMLASGSLLFLSEALKCYGSSAFRVKMLLLLAALVFHVTVFRTVSRTDESKVGPAWRKAAGALGLALWFGVGLAGRGIAFLE